MSLPAFLYSSNREPLSCVDMHTVGMPTRIILSGYPNISGTLLEQRTQAKLHHDYIRTRLLQEPRGHSGMYGAVLRPETEHTRSGEAHMRVLYLHGEGYSNMCGHATIAVCRLLADLQDMAYFPRRHDLIYSAETRSVRLVLHTPGGLVESDVPTIQDGTRSDPTRPVSFVAIPAFSLATDLSVDILEPYRWPEIGDRPSITISLACASAVSCHVDVGELGFPPFGEAIDITRLDFATRQLKAALNNSELVKSHLAAPNQNDTCVFGVMVEDKNTGSPAEGTNGAETGMYFFGDQHLDRSPTGSVVAARNTLKYARRKLEIGESWTYHSVLTNRHGSEYGFVGKTLRLVETGAMGQNMKGVVVQVSGHAYYSGVNTYVMEKEDLVGQNGFLLEHLDRKGNK